MSTYLEEVQAKIDARNDRESVKRREQAKKLRGKVERLSRLKLGPVQEPLAAELVQDQ